MFFLSFFSSKSFSFLLGGYLGVMGTVNQSGTRTTRNNRILTAVCYSP